MIFFWKKINFNFCFQPNLWFSKLHWHLHICTMDRLLISIVVPDYYWTSIYIAYLYEEQWLQIWKFLKRLDGDWTNDYPYLSGKLVPEKTEVYHLTYVNDWTMLRQNVSLPSKSTFINMFLYLLTCVTSTLFR